MVKCYTNNIIKNLILKSLDIFVSNGFNMPIMKFFIIGLLFLGMGVNGLEAANRFSVATGNWDATSTWAATTNGTAGASVPVAGDIVYLERGYTVTVNTTAACASINIGRDATNGSGNNTRTGFLTFSATGALTVSGSVQVGGSSNGSSSGTITFVNGASMTAGNIVLGNATSNSAGTITMTSGSTLTLNGPLTVGGIGTKTWTPSTSTVVFNANNTLPTSIFTSFCNLSTTAGTTTLSTALLITGNLNVGTGSSLDLGINTANRSTTGGILTIAGTLLLGGSNFPTSYSTVTTTGGTVNYDNLTGGQTIYSTPAYNNLILSNTSGTQTAGGALTVNGALTTSAGSTLNMGTNQLLLGTLATVINTGTIQTQNTSATPIPTGKTWGGTVVFNGSSNQTITASTFNNVIVSNSVSATLSGIVTANLFSVTNTFPTAILGGSSTSFVNGPINWTFPASLVAGSTYNFPVGKGSTYLPFSLVNPTGTGATAQIEAFNVNGGGIIDASLNSKSNTEYWSLATTGNFTSSSVSAIRQTAIAPNDVIAGSTTVAGQYTNLGGIPGTFGVTGSNDIGSNRAFAFAAKKTISTGIITGSTFCAGASVSIPFNLTGSLNSGNIFTAQLSDVNGIFASPVSIGTLTSTTSGTISATIPVGTVFGSGYRIRVVSSNPVITGTDNGVNITINASPSAPTTTGNNICIGTTSGTVLSASGAVSGESYNWYDSGGTIIPGANTNTYTTPVLATTTNYWVSIKNAGGCESSQTIVTATYPAASTADQNAVVSNSWIGHVYDGIAFNTYFGSFTATETFDQNFGGATSCFPFTSISDSRSIYTETFSVRYRMNSTKKGLYIVDLGSDDGSRLTVDGTLLYNNWADQSYVARPRILINLTGTSSLVYDFYENGGQNQVVFQNLTQVLSNNLTTNTSQTINIGTNGTAISGDVFGTLQTGISLSGTGYQWTYSTTLGGARTAISGATGATFTPNSTTAPFNTPGTYYIFRNAVLSSVNNVSPNPYIATSESNYATLIVNTPLITTTPTSLTGFNYIFGSGPSAQQSFTVGGTYLIANVTITPSANYEISTTSGIGFASTPITLTQSGGTVATTTIYVRLKAGLSAGNYNSENVASTSTSAVTKNVICSGVVNTPTITASPISITTFTYPVGNGPSAVDSMTVSGVNLVDNIVVTPPADFEISTTKTPFVTSGLITLPISGGGVLATKIYIRMKAGHAFGAVAAENIASTSTGANAVDVNCSGNVVLAPNIITSAISPAGTFSYVFGSGPSVSRTFTVSGTYLGGSVIITPPVDYEISSNGGTNYYSTAITLPISSGNASIYTGVLNSTTITVRLKIGLGTGSYSENVVASSISAVSQNVALSGNVAASATITTIPSYLGAFSYTFGFGGTVPIGEQTFAVVGTNLTTDVKVKPPLNFQISKTSGTGFISYPDSLTLTQTGGSVNTTIYARMASGLAVGTYGASNVSLTCTGAVVKTVGLYGEVLAVNTPKILASKDIVTGFGYMQGTGPSSVQSFTASGASLTSQNLSVALSDTTYQISLNPTSGFQTTPITLTGTSVASTPASYKVSPTIIYIRLKAGNLAGNYRKAITLTSGSISKKDSLIGVVFVSPLITAGGGREYCAGTTINLTSTGADIQNRYWQGPNSFYSTAQNPSIPNATTAMSGTYTSTGNVFIGGNLIYNGDFESGNTGFGSSYGYVVPSASALNPEALYTVVKLPSSVHNDFTNWPDHTTGTGYQMVVNGAPTAGVVVWTQSVPVIPGATYQFIYSEQTVNITQVPKNASQLQLYVNGVAAGPVYTAPQVNYQWATFIYNAAAGSNSVLNLELINQNTIATGNDFALDDIIFQQILPATSSTNVTVTPIVPVSISIAASPGTTVFSNTPVTFTATPTNGGLTPNYQWKVKTAAGSWVNAGTNSPNYMYTPLPGDSVSCTLTSSLSCVTNNPATAKLAMTVNFRTNYWYGYVSTDWGNTANWTGKYIPAPGEDVEYATRTNTPDSATFAVKDLWLDRNRTIGSLINATIRRLVIPAAKGLTVNNTINIVDKTNEADRIYIYSSTTAANGSLIYHNAVDNPVSATVEMYSKAWWNKADTINNRYRWQYFGIPLRSVKAEPTFNGSFVRKWYETGTTIQNHWKQLQNDSLLRPFYGYEICQAAPKTIYFQGILENGNFNSGALAITPTALYPGQHVLANPYTAAIDIRQLVFGTTTEASVYLYNTGTYSIWEFDHGRSTTSYEGQYMVVPKAHAGDIGIPRQVPSMQAMVVKAKAATDPTFSINYNLVVMNNTDQQRVQGVGEDLTSDKVGTKIDLVGTHYSDKMWLFSQPGCTSSFDNGFDGFKLAGNAFMPQLYSLGSDGIYQVNTTDNINDTEIAFQAGSDVEYRMIFTNENVLKQYQALYLLDLVENKTIDITQSGTEYLFQAESTPKPINRFRIVTRPYEKNAPDLDSQLKIFSSGKTIFVDNLGNSAGDLYIYDIAGHFIKKAPFALKTITSVSLNISSGAYIVKAVTSGEDVSKRVLIK